MTTEQLLSCLPEELARRFRCVVPGRERNTFVQRLPEQALPAEDGGDDPLYLPAQDG